MTGRVTRTFMKSVGSPLPPSAQSLLRIGRDDIVDAAAELADAEGLSMLGPGRLADRLCAKPRALYNHFANIEEIKEALAARAIAEMIDLHRDVAHGLSGREALFALAHSLRTYAQARPGRYLAAAFATRRRAASVAALMESQLRIFASALETCDLADDKALNAARGVMSALQGFLVVELHGGVGGPFDTDQSYQDLLQIIHAGVRATPGPASRRKRVRRDDVATPPVRSSPVAGPQPSATLVDYVWAEA